MFVVFLLFVPFLLTTKKTKAHTEKKEITKKTTGERRENIQADPDPDCILILILIHVLVLVLVLCPFLWI